MFWWSVEPANFTHFLQDCFWDSHILDDCRSAITTGVKKHPDGYAFLIHTHLQKYVLKNLQPNNIVCIFLGIYNPFALADLLSYSQLSLDHSQFQNSQQR